jgi:hypothetical protein
MLEVAGEDVSVREVTVTRKQQQQQHEAKGKGKGKKTKKARRVAELEEDGDDGEQDEEEALLEKLVFGKVNAAELFGPGGSSAPATRSDDEEGEGAGWAAAEGRTPSMRPAWEDEDDAAVRVDIAGKDRLRKLRKAAEERDISGAEYQERLRARCVCVWGKGDALMLLWCCGTLFRLRLGQPLILSRLY